MSKQIVMRDSPEAAQHRPDLKGGFTRWFLLATTAKAREQPATPAAPMYRASAGDAPTPKGYTQCRGCRDPISSDEAMPAPSGTARFLPEAGDQYYSTPDDAAEDLEEDQTLADLRLVICEPNYVRQPRTGLLLRRSARRTATCRTTWRKRWRHSTRLWPASCFVVARQEGAGAGLG